MDINAIGFLGVIALLAGYLVPSFIAAIRNHPNVMSITVLNLFLGWTGLGWVAALVWSFTVK